MSALDRLFRFARRAEFDGAHRVASAAVWEDWSKRAGEKGNRKSLGTVAAEGKRLVFEATSRRRAENGRTLIEAVAGVAVTHRATTYEDVEQAMKRRRGRPRKAPDFPPDVKAELTSDFYERHHGAWLDPPLPALGGAGAGSAGVTRRMRAGRGRPRGILWRTRCDRSCHRSVGG